MSLQKCVYRLDVVGLSTLVLVMTLQSQTIDANMAVVPHDKIVSTVVANSDDQALNRDRIYRDSRVARNPGDVLASEDDIAKAQRVVGVLNNLIQQKSSLLFNTAQDYATYQLIVPFLEQQLPAIRPFTGVYVIYSDVQELSALCSEYDAAKDNQTKAKILFKVPQVCFDLVKDLASYSPDFIRAAIHIAELTSQAITIENIAGIAPMMSGLVVSSLYVWAGLSAAERFEQNWTAYTFCTYWSKYQLSDEHVLPLSALQEGLLNKYAHRRFPTGYSLTVEPFPGTPEAARMWVARNGADTLFYEFNQSFEQDESQRFLHNKLQMFFFNPSSSHSFQVNGRIVLIDNDGRTQLIKVDTSYLPFSLTIPQLTDTKNVGIASFDLPMSVINIDKFAFGGRIAIDFDSDGKYEESIGLNLPQFLNPQPATWYLEDVPQGATVVQAFSLGEGGVNDLQNISFSGGIYFPHCPDSIALFRFSPTAISKVPSGSQNSRFEATVTIPNSVIPGEYRGIIVVRSSTGGMRNIDVKMKVTSGSNGYYLTTNPNLLYLTPGQSGSIQIGVRPINNFASPVTISTKLQSSETSISMSFLRNPVSPGDSSTLSVSCLPSTPRGDYSILVYGTAGVRTQSIPVHLTIADRPTLSGGSVNPTSGDETTRFTWSVQYRDPLGAGPSSGRIYIDNAAHELALTSGTPAIGATFSYSDFLSQGSHQFYFVFQTRIGDIRNSASGGPAVSGLGLPLSNGHVEPQTGSASTTFDYYVTYTSPSGKTPTKVVVVIDETLSPAMNKVSGSYGTGALFKYSAASLGVGQHKFRFYANIDNSTVSLPGHWPDNIDGPIVVQQNQIAVSVRPDKDPNSYSPGDQPVFLITCRDNANNLIDIDRLAISSSYTNYSEFSALQFRQSTGTYRYPEQSPLPAGCTNYTATALKAGFVTGSGSIILKVGSVPEYQPLQITNFAVSSEFVGQSTLCVISYVLSDSAIVTLDMRDKNGIVVRTILKNQRRYPGPDSIRWDGKDSTGLMVPEGKYTASLMAIGDKPVHEPAFFGVSGMGNGQIQNITGMAINRVGTRIYCADHNLNRIAIFDQSGSFVQSFGFQGTGDGQLNSPNGVAVDGYGKIYVVDWAQYNGGRIQCFSSGNLFIWSLEDFIHGDVVSNCVRAGLSDTVYVGATPGLGSPPPGVAWFFGGRQAPLFSVAQSVPAYDQYITGVAADKFGCIYTGVNTGVLRKFTSLGTFLWSKSPGGGQIDVDVRNGELVYVRTSVNLIVYDLDGNELLRKDLTNNAPLGNKPAIAVDNAGNIFTTARSNDGTRALAKLFDPTTIAKSQRIITMDRTKPIARLIQPSQGLLVDGRIKDTLLILGTDYDDHLDRYTLEYRSVSVGQSWSVLFAGNTAVHDSILFTWKALPLQTGTYWIRLSVNDSAGNVAMDSVTFRYIDGHAPKARITSLTSNSRIRGVVKLTAKVEDTDVFAVAFQSRSLNAVNWVPISIPDSSAPFGVTWNTGIVIDGFYYLRAIATDTVSNIDLSPDSLLVYVDNTAPRVTITSPRDGDIIRTIPLKFTISCNDSDLCAVEFQYRSENTFLNPSWISIDSTVTRYPFQMSWNLSQLAMDTVYQIRAVGSDGVGNFDVSAPYIRIRTAKTITAISGEYSSIPRQFSLSQNYPNPFNPSTMINYALPKAASVTLKIFNVLGQLVTTLVDGYREAGYHQVQWNANVPSGIYYYRLQAGKFVETKKTVVVK
ncbi:MAG: FlgD immunoglobulin-like domain containing protein [bacterium]